LISLSTQIDEVEVKSFPQLELVLQSHLMNGMVGSWTRIFTESTVNLVQSWIFTPADFASAKSLQEDGL
jgi:hypothetical protein